MINKKRGIRLTFNNRKGITHDLFFNVFELILAFIVILNLLNFVNDVAEATLLKKNYLVRDISLLVNALYAAPATVDYRYDEDMKGLKIEFSKNRLRVFKVDEGDKGVKALYLFGENIKASFVSYPIITYGEEATTLDFIKSTGNLDIKSTGEVEVK